MASNDLQVLLTSRGFQPEEASRIAQSIDGTDLVNLISSLNSNTPEGNQTAEQILQGYGYQLKDKGMTERTSYLDALYKSAQTQGKLHTVEGIEGLNLSESGNAEDRALALEGFNYFTNVSEDKSHNLVDWLEENGVDYLTDGRGKFHIKCEDRARAYHVGREISRLGGAPVVRDSVGESKMTKKEFNRVKPRDPNAETLNKLQKKNPADLENIVKDRKMKQGDKFSRNAKHKGKKFDESIEPKIIEEGVLGMSNMETIGRLRELAGLPPAPLKNAKKPITVEDDFDDIDLPGDVDGIGADPVSPVDDGPLPDDMTSGTDMVDDAGTLDAPVSVDAGVPGDLPPSPLDGANTPMDSTSPAMSSIQDAINNISGSLSDLKVSEYKQVVNQLTSLLNNARDTGRNFLGEQSGYQKKISEMDFGKAGRNYRMTIISPETGTKEYENVSDVKLSQIINKVGNPELTDLFNKMINAIGGLQTGKMISSSNADRTLGIVVRKVR